MISFKRKHFKQDIILMLVRWYVAYGLSYRDVEELALERGLKVDHFTIHRWVVEYSPKLEAIFRKRHKCHCGSSLRMDKTCIKVKGVKLIILHIWSNDSKSPKIRILKEQGYICYHRALKKWMMTMPEDYLLTKNGARLTCISGDKKMSANWLFIPSPGLSSDSLTELANLLDNQVNAALWMLDYPGDGDNVSENFNFANWQPALVEGITALNHPVLIAHSTGGMYVQSIPELETLASGLIFIGSAPNMGWKEACDHHMQENMSAEMHNCATKYGMEPSDEALRRLIMASMKFSFMPKSFIAASKMLQRLAINHSAADWSDTHFDIDYKAKAVPQLLPTLILGGEYDQIIPLTVYSDREEYHRKNIRVQSISQAGHFPWFDNPEETLEVILDFVAAYIPR